MREMEFLPAWYPRLRRRKRFLFAQASIAGGMLLSLGLWTIISQRNLFAAEASLDHLQTQLHNSNADLARLADVQAAHDQMSQQIKLIAGLGPDVSSARLLDVLDQMLPPDIGLLDLSIANQSSDASAATVHRRAITLHGVAPSDAPIGNLLTRLSAVACFSGIAMPYSRDRVDNGRRMREFEITFTINLDGLDQPNLPMESNIQ